MILRNRTCPKNKEFCVFPKKTCPKNKEFHEKWLHNRFLILGEAVYFQIFSKLRAETIPVDNIAISRFIAVTAERAVAGA